MKGTSHIEERSPVVAKVDLSKVPSQGSTSTIADKFESEGSSPLDSKRSTPEGSPTAAAAGGGWYSPLAAIGSGLASLAGGIASVVSNTVSSVKQIFTGTPQEILTNQVRAALKLSEEQELPAHYQKMIDELAESPDKAQAVGLWLQQPLVDEKGKQTKANSLLEEAGINGSTSAALARLRSRIEYPAEYAKSTIQNLYGMELPEKAQQVMKENADFINSLVDGFPEMIQSGATLNEIAERTNMLQQEFPEELGSVARAILQRARLANTQSNTDGLGYNFIPEFMPEGVLERFQAAVQKSVYQKNYENLPQEIRSFVESNFRTAETYWQIFDKPVPDYGAGWLVNSVPNEKGDAIMKGRRVLGIADVLSNKEPRARFGTVSFDFSELGSINLEQAKAIIKAVHARAQNGGESEKAVGEQKKELASLFTEGQIEFISPRLTEFIRNCERKYEEIHGELFRYRGSKKHQSELIRNIDSEEEPKTKAEALGQSKKKPPSSAEEESEEN